MGNTNAKKLYDAEVRIAELEKELGSIKGMYDKMINQKNYVNMILDNMPIAEFRMDENNIITGVTHTDDTFLGYKLDEFIGRHFSSFLTQDNDSLAYTSDMMKSFHTSKDVTYRMKRKDGGVDYVEVFTVIIGGSPFKKSMAINITERVRINEVLHNLEREKAAILDALRDCVLYLNTDLKIVWANKVAGEMRVATLDMMIGKECFKVCGMLGRYCGNCPVTLVKKYGTRHDSNICINDRSYLCTATPVHDEKGCFIGIVHVIRDITERKRLEKKILSITGEERIRIGQELHDGLGQILTGISYTAKLIEKRITEKKEVEISSAQLISENVLKARKLVRDILKGLRPVENDPEGLIAAVRELGTNIAQMYGIECNVYASESFSVSDSETATHVFFVIQEAVCNSVKHSECSVIDIYLEESSQSLVVIIKDNGKGFDLNTSSKLGMGVSGMYYRASILSASLIITSKPGGGCMVRLEKTLEQCP